MKRYLDHMHQKPTHERRRHAMRVAGILTALVFVGWITTLGVQLGTPSTSSGQAAVAGTDNSSQTATVLNMQTDNQGNQLIVASSTGY
jgi:hypothetical protein